MHRLIQPISTRYKEGIRCLMLPWARIPPRRALWILVIVWQVPKESVASLRHHRRMTIPWIRWLQYAILVKAPFVPRFPFQRIVSSASRAAKNCCNGTALEQVACTNLVGRHCECSRTSFPFKLAISSCKMAEPRVWASWYRSWPHRCLVHRSSALYGAANATRSNSSRCKHTCARMPRPQSLWLKRISQIAKEFTSSENRCPNCRHQHRRRPTFHWH
mmetsp:Transcript_21053/g.58577  ORF Transcript_21053/g.58577 Transcript_21053/m.58577 type:complete len:218 (-) Transcript_21053:1698-2351(-)